jgi:hypothetical protein
LGCPVGSVRARDAWVKAPALDVHRDFCEVAIVEDGKLSSRGRVASRLDPRELFAPEAGAGRCGA